MRIERDEKIASSDKGAYPNSKVSNSLDTIGSTESTRSGTAPIMAVAELSTPLPNFLRMAKESPRAAGLNQLFRQDTRVAPIAFIRLTPFSERHG